VLVRAASGFAGAATSTLAMLYMLQALPRAYVGKMLVVGVGIAQLATPLAWVLSPSLLESGEWHNLYRFEAGLALCSFAAVVVLKLPPGTHIKVFEKRDFLTFALLAPGSAMLVGVLAQGYSQWWLDTQWLAWMLIGAVVLLSAAFYIEHHRESPLIQTRWLTTPGMLRFILGAFLIRFLTSEQSYGAVGLLRTLGMGPDQMQALFVVVLVGTVAGIAASALTFSPATMIPQILVSILLFGVAAFLDYGRTSLDRPEDFFTSQFLVAVGAGMFMGPLIMAGFMQALQHGPNYIITFTVTLSMSQVMGGLAGSAALSTYQLHREHVYSAAIIAQLNPADPMVAQRLRLQERIYQPQVSDPTLRGAQGMALLAQTARREANVRAFNDVFAVNAIVALLFLFWLLWRTMLARRTKKLGEAAQSATPGGNRT
jgi:hypothetical protein